MDLKKIYYYVICLAALFVLFWGTVDLISTVVGLTTSKSAGVEQNLSSPPEGASEQTLDLYYQKKMLYDRLSDSLARIVVAGLVFGFSRMKVSRLEG